jgi:hypothetical protein
MHGETVKKKPPFYFPQNDVYFVISFPLSVQIVRFFINHPLKFKYPPGKEKWIHKINL